jgi:peptide-methionine (S)-S-oxide reductase
VVSTRAGYAGGLEENPTYYDLGGHSETVQIEYDPSVITYRQLLEVFFESHDAAAQPYSTQYRSVIFYHNEEQRRLAMEAAEEQAVLQGARIYTAILPYTGFYLAEDYHQKYYLSAYRDIYSEMRAIYPDTEDFVSSTAAARLNGYAGAYGSAETLKDNLDKFGLSEAARQRLLELTGGGLVPVCPVP